MPRGEATRQVNSLREMRIRSRSSMEEQISLKEVFGCQWRRDRALEASPQRKSTSVGRIQAGFTPTTGRPRRLLYPTSSTPEPCQSSSRSAAAKTVAARSRTLVEASGRQKYNLPEHRSEVFAKNPQCTQAHSPNHAVLREYPSSTAGIRPRSMRATASVILRVTKVNPRSADS